MGLRVLLTRCRSCDRNMTDKVVPSTGDRVVIDYPVEQEAYERLGELIYEYNHDMSVASMVGILECLKNDLLFGREE